MEVSRSASTNPPFIPSRPATSVGLGLRGRPSGEHDPIHVKTQLITPTKPVQIAADYAMRSTWPGGGGGGDGRVAYDGFAQHGRGLRGSAAKDIRDGIPLAIENYALLHRLWTEDVVDWQGKYRTPAGFQTRSPRHPLGRASRRSSGTAHPLPEIGTQAASLR